MSIVLIVTWRMRINFKQNIYFPLITNVYHPLTSLFNHWFPNHYHWLPLVSHLLPDVEFSSDTKSWENTYWLFGQLLQSFNVGVRQIAIEISDDNRKNNKLNDK